MQNRPGHIGVRGGLFLPWMASRHMPPEPQEVISKKTIMKETEKPATRKAALCGGSGEGGAVSRATRRGGRRVHVEKHTIQRG